VARQNQGRKFREEQVEYSNTLNWELRVFEDGKERQRRDERKTFVDTLANTRQGNEFDASQMVEKISAKFIYEQESVQRAQLAQRLPQRFFDAAPFVRVFTEAASALSLLEAEAATQVEELESEVREREAEHHEHVRKLEATHKQLGDSFRALDSRINDIGNIAVQIGDRLESLDAQKRRATEVEQLLRSMIDANQGIERPRARAAAVGGMDEQVRLMRELVLTADECAAVPRLQRAVEFVAQAAERLENSLLGTFDEAFDEDDLERARDIARVLHAWNGGRACVQHYLAKVDLFFDADAVFASASSVAADLFEAQLHERHAHILESCVREKAVIEQVFPNPRDVLKLLLERVFAQCVAPLVTGLIESKELANARVAVVSKTDALTYAEQCHAAFVETRRLTTSLWELLDTAKVAAIGGAGSGGDGDGGGDEGDERDDDGAAERNGAAGGNSSTSAGANANGNGGDDASAGRHLLPEEITPSERVRELFAPALARYELMEMSALDAMYDEMRAQYEHRVHSVVGDDERTAATNEDASSELILATSEMALEAVYNAAAAMARARTMLMEAEDEASAKLRREHESEQQQELSILGPQDGAAPDDRLAARLASLFASLVQFVRSALLTDGVRRASAQVSRADLRSSAAVSAAVSGGLRALQATQQVLVLLQRHYHDEVLPHLQHAINWHTKCVLQVSSLEKYLENELSQCLKLCIIKFTHRLERILNEHWKKTEFKLPDDLAMFEHATPGAQYIISLCRSVRQSATACLDGANLTRFLECVGLSVARQVRRHLGVLQISKGGGGLKLMRDLNEMKEVFQSWPSAAIQSEFELLRDIANLFIVDEQQWRSVIEASSLMRLSRNDILLLVQRRTDFKSTFAKKYLP
jgi:hypothetical protein